MFSKTGESQGQTFCMAATPNILGTFFLDAKNARKRAFSIFLGSNVNFSFRHFKYVSTHNIAGSFSTD